ncbi:MAG: hypothetical protein GY702_08640, partial [Desulfobulbaceae bacterium]|nr:hypothetical protein [Desulfobulbaceae bacterium]
MENTVTAEEKKPLISDEEEEEALKFFEKLFSSEPKADEYWRTDRIVLTGSQVPVFKAP